MVEGCIKFYACRINGIHKPDIVKQYIEEKLDSNDSVGQWLNEKTEFKRREEIKDMDRKQLREFTTLANACYTDFWNGRELMN